MADALPSLDQAFGGPAPANDPNRLPTLDEAFAGAEPQPHDSASMDQFLSQHAVGRVLNAFGQGAKQGWGTDPVGYSGETTVLLKKAGVYADHLADRNAMLKAFNVGVVRPAIFGSQALAGSLSNVVRGVGAAFGGVEAGVAKAGEEAGAPILGRDIAGIIEKETQTGGAEYVGMVPHGPVGRDLGVIHTSIDLRKARGLGVVGEGEGGYFGTVEPQPESTTARAEAVKQQVSEQAATAPAEPVQPGGAPGAVQAPETAPAPAQPTDIHAVARQIAPATFQEYDALSQRKDTFRRWIGELDQTRTAQAEADAPHGPEIADLQARMEDATPRLQKKYAERLGSLQAERQDFIDGATKGDSPDMARVRQELQRADYRQRDLAPDVAAAYRQAQEAHPEMGEVAEARAPAAENVAHETPEATTPPQQPADASAPAGPGPSIAADVSKKLVNAGRPSEEADAAAALIQAHYEARSARFDGKKGSAYELYAKEAPNIRGVKTALKNTAQRAQTLNQAAAPTTPEFKKWFGESKVLDKDGNPQVVYHGTDKNFKQFNPKKATMGGISWFTSDKSAIEKGEVGAQGKGKILNLYASIKNPAGWAEYEKFGLGELKSHGFDGAILPEKDGTFTGFVFEPTQLKSVENKGAFDPTNPKLLEQPKRGSITLGNARNTIRLMKDADASTFIHETGHDWLEEMMRDAGDDHAPEDLKQDASTVREFIGAKEGEAIPTRAHEKFARSFERYMREGVAPSKELAGIFVKFKNWLTKIYEVMSAKRYPINDDIRDVFDRLLSKNPEKTIVAPEQTAERSMADIHEADAEHVAPEHAAETADNIRSEIERQVTEKAPEIADEFTAGRTGGIPTPDTGAAGGGDEAGRGPGPAVTPDEPGAVPAGGNEGAQEGGDVPGSDAGAGATGGGSGSTGPTAEPTGANERFTNPESNLVDKAGNIRLDNLNTPEDVNQVIRETASDNGGFMAARRGVLTDGEVLDLADALGVNPAFLDGRKLGQAFNAEQIMAARKLLIKSATNLRDLMRKVAGGTDADVMAYAEAKARHIMIQEQVSGITAEAGRALRAFRKIEGGEEAKAVGDFLKDATGRTLNQLREEAKLGASLETPSQVSKYMDDLNKHPLKNAVLEYYINALISGPVTHFRYSVGNALNALWTPLVQIPIAATIGAGREALGLGADANRVYMGEAGAQLFAMMKGSRDGWKAATEAFTSGMSPSLPGERFHQQIPGAIPGKIGEVIRLPGKSVSAIHSFFKSLRYEQNIQGLAYRTAMNEGLSGDAFTNRVSDLTMRPTADMMDEAGHLDPAKVEAQHLENVEDATQNALKELYMSPTKYDSAMGALNRAVDRSLVAKIIIPFMKIGSQITRNAFVEQTPLGLFSKDIRDEFSKGGAAADFQAAKMAGGIALAGITVGLAAEELATGDGPEDPRQRAVWMLNHRPNTVTIGDISIPYQGLGSLGMLMRFSANTYDVAHQIGHADNSKLAVAFLEGATKSVLDENFMRGVKDALDAVYHSEEYGANYLKGFATNWLPFSVGLSQVSRMIDPDQREAQGLWDEAKRKIPFESETLEIRRDMFGEHIPNSGPLPDYAADPVVKAMEALRIAPGKLTRKIRGIPITDEQYDQYSMLAGRMAKMQLNTVVALPGFDQFPAVTRIELMHKAISSSREIARARIMAEDPTIITRAMQAKIDPLKDQQSDFTAAVPEAATQQ